MRSVPARSGPRRPPRTDRSPLGSPLFVLNLKTYPNCLGTGAIALAQILEGVARNYGVRSAIAPAMPDLEAVAERVRVPVVAQHVDPTPPGASTGSVPPEAIRAAGARGSLLNHSERPVAPAVVGDSIARLRPLGLVPIVCAGTAALAARLAVFAPEYLAVEPPELIGGNRAVSTAKPEVVSATVAAVRAVAPASRVLCGAGVHTRFDVRRAIALGADGVLVASAVTRSPDPRAAIEELLTGF